MRSKTTGRSGSALLIVLGMVSFMLFSGLAFSVYMRYARLPTSFLRRTTVSRQLAKAALAQAIEVVDKAIGNNPHPGVNISGGGGSNIWRHRVFFGGDSLGFDTTETVPILPLEGLAYLPPNLINDVRYYSHCTPTAKWQPFWFDSGRFAYVAIDVSDYFDINRVVADAPRAASADRRVTLAHLFEQIGEDGEHTGTGSGASKWDAMMGRSGSGGKAASDNKNKEIDPFVSLAELNIAWKSAITFGGESVQSPFRRFVTDKEGRAYGNISDGDDKAEYYRQLTFVTDSWSPAPKRKDNATVADLENKRYQPFKMSDLENANATTTKVLEYNSDLLDMSGNYLGGRICDLTRVALWDYLDTDKVPVSLGLPTCEQVPMICAIQPEFSGTLKFSREDGEEITIRENKTEKIVQREVTYSIVLQGAGSDLSGFVAWTYPFLLKDREAKTNGSNDKFSLDGRVALFLTEDGVNMSKCARQSALDGLYLKNQSDVEASGVAGDMVLTYPFKAASSKAPANIMTDKKPVQDAQFTAKNGISESRKLFKITYQWNKKQSENPNYTSKDQAIAIKKPDGSAFGYFSGSGGKALKATKDFSLDKIKNGLTLRVSTAIWARVTDANNKTVDLAPACLMDDKNLNNINNSEDVGYFQDKPYPLLAITADTPVTLSLESLNSNAGVSYAINYATDGKALVTGDPRYNHAPENWKIVTGVSGSPAEYWYTQEKNYAKAKDGDIYMATSDQGYMQSVYELMMLPRLQTAGIAKNGFGNGFGSYSFNYNGEIRTGSETLKDHDFMWRTYGRGDFSEIEDGLIVAGDSGQKVNPYSDSTNVLMAAFANTPLDWRAASTNDEELASMDTKDFNKQYAWNNYNEKERGHLCWEHLAEFAGEFSEVVRDNVWNSTDPDEVAHSWETAFRNMQWSSSEDELLVNQKLDSADTRLYSVDKKFLYGFWHDSFSARQQLFLIFLRAEPMLMGGGVSGQAPPQLGARAVALVWRDPHPYYYKANTLAPVHRTRILFYHTFD